jgi:hypothetical protein
MSRAKTSTKYYKRNQSNQTKVAHRKKTQRRTKNNNNSVKCRRVRSKRMGGIGSKRYGGVNEIPLEKRQEVIKLVPTFTSEK